MVTNYNEGRYAVYDSQFPGAEPIGWINNEEYVKSISGQNLWRIDGDEVYTLDGKYLSTIEEGIAADSHYNFIFSIHKQK